MEDTAGTENFEQVRITTINEKEYVLTNVTVDSTHIISTTSLLHSEWINDDQESEIIIPLEEIEEFEVASLDVGQTTCLGLTLGFFILKL